MWFWKKGIRSTLKGIEQRLENIQMDISRLLGEVNRQRTVIAGVGALISAITSQLNEMKNHPTVTDDPELAKQLEDITNTLQANTDQLSQAVQNNTPAQPTTAGGSGGAGQPMTAAPSPNDPSQGGTGGDAGTPGSNS